MQDASSLKDCGVFFSLLLFSLLLFVSYLSLVLSSRHGIDCLSYEAEGEERSGKQE